MKIDYFLHSSVKPSVLSVWSEWPFSWSCRSSAGHCPEGQAQGEGQRSWSGPGSGSGLAPVFFSTRSYLQMFLQHCEAADALSNFTLPAPGLFSRRLITHTSASPPPPPTPPIPTPPPLLLPLPLFSAQPVQSLFVAAEVVMAVEDLLLLLHPVSLQLNPPTHAPPAPPSRLLVNHFQDCGSFF